MARKKKSVSGLQFDSRYVYSAQYLPDDEVVTSISIQPLETIDQEDYWDSVNSGLRELVQGVKLAGEQVIASLPGDCAIVKKVCLDKNEAMVEDALEWEFSQHIVSGTEDYSFDYEKLTSSIPDCDEYLLVGYRNFIIERLKRIFKTSKLIPLIIDLDLFALINVFEVNYPEDKSSTVLLSLSDQEKTSLVATKDGGFLDYEILKHDNDEMTGLQLAELIKQGVTRIKNCNSDINESGFAKTLLAGNFLADKATQTEVIGQLKDCEIIQPFRKITCTVGMDEETLHQYTPQIAVAVGLALRGAEVE